MKLSKKSWLYLAFFVLLAVGFYFTLSVLIPGYSEKKFPPINTIRPFSFVNQDGQRLTDSNMLGKVYAVEYFYTTCPGICPRMNKNMRKVYDELNKENDFKILSLTCDPKTDSAAKLKHYADSMQVDTQKWIFLTGRKDSLYSAARLSFSIDDPANIVRNEEDDFMHSQNWALVNRKGEVVGIFDGLKKSEVKDLIKKAKRLLKEK
ncbi:MAG TPA: SCO family protein [Chitinophagaceae bacterium]|nr:SCO family protein [Chitinophagaceae bacterium]